ncbi:polysaccharide deacetylase family protein [Micromonospora sp. NPDC001898]|uniref:polysaccharide deacetylase family protein n=1 Tax=Micromonospora sp. NPDC001898 TaxID=3364221 RepID=UPI00367F8CA6
MTPTTPRIAYSYGESGAGLEPPAPGRGLIVHVVLNVEHWPLDAPMPRKLLGSPHGADHIPDVPNYSWAEYGMRRGLPRVVSALTGRGLPASVSFNAAVIDAYPEAAGRLRDTGWEFVAHGLHQQALPSAPDESVVIDECLRKIEEFTGRRPRGWLGPGLQETFTTPDLLAAAGVDYTCDWVVDDVPVWLAAQPRPLVALPYSLELNDSIIYATEKHSSDEMYRRFTETVEVLAAEAALEPRVLTLPIHPHMVGVPHRIRYFDRILDELSNREDVIFLTGSEICDWFTGQRPATEH